MFHRKQNSIARLTAILALMLVVSTFAAPAAHAQSYNTLTIQNDSRYDIHRVYLSPASRGSWGADLLGRQILYTNFVYTAHYVANGYYDLKLVDEDGDVCVVWNVNVSGDTDWHITNSWLLRCEFH